jgi:Flp pilus assembly protein TadG
MRRFWKDRTGYVMAYVVVLIGTVTIPMLILSVEIGRAMYVEVQLQAAVNAACESAAQAVNVPVFIDTGVLQIEEGAATANAQREFDATVISSNITGYTPTLGVAFPTSISVACTSSATLVWLLPGVPSLTLHADAFSQARTTLPV